MAGNLRARLARIRQYPVSENNKGKDVTSVPRKEQIDFPAGWSMPEAGLRVKETVASAGNNDLAMPLHLKIFSARPGLPDASLRDVVFFDLETTGLSGGSGTVAFLAAFGSFRDDGSLSVRQYFMDDYPSEPVFLEYLAQEFEKAPVVVTFNGSSFDMPLYAVRRTMNRLGPPPPQIHIDALHAARRLWRRTIGNCSLGNLETEILDLGREGDIPGAEVPEVWFEYLRQGKTDRLSQVFLHNELDIRSLASLFQLMYKTVVTSGMSCSCDSVGLAELQVRFNENLAEQTLSLALQAGNQRATRPLMRLYARQGHRERRSVLVPLLPDDPAGLFTKSVYAERIARNLEDALQLAERAVVDAKGLLRERTQRRILRLMQKMRCAQMR